MKVGVAAPACEFIVLPVSAQDANGLAAYRGGVVVGKAGEVRSEEGHKKGVVFWGVRRQAGYQGGDVLAAGPIEVEEERWMCRRWGERGKRDGS